LSKAGITDLLDHQAEVEQLVQAMSQGLAHHQLTFMLFPGKLTVVLTFHQDDVMGRHKKHIGLGAKYTSHTASASTEILVRDALPQEIVIPSSPSPCRRVADFAPGRRPPHLVYSEILGQTEETIVVSDELVFQARLASALVVVRREEVAQGETEVEDLGNAGFLDRAGASKSLEEPKSAFRLFKQRDEQTDLKAPFGTVNIPGESGDWLKGFGVGDLWLEQPAVLGWNI
jgi:hypothetical protein